MKRLLTIATLTLLLTGCSFDLPEADAGTVDVFHYENSPSRVVSERLTFAQISALGSWVAKHNTGWEYKVMDLAPQTVVVLTRQGATVAGMNIGDSFVYAKSRYRALTKEEAAELRRIVTPAFAGAGKETAAPSV